MQIDLAGMDEVKAMIVALGEELAEVDRKTQNRLAYEIRLAEQEQMRADLDRPVQWTVDSVLYKKSGEVGPPGAPVVEGAAVFFNTPFEGGPGLVETEYLGVQIAGGKTAGPRRSEVSLGKMGLLDSDKVWVPAPGVALNSSGNINGSIISSMLADFKRNGAYGDNFVAIGKPPVAVLARVFAGGASTWAPFLYFVSRRSYQQRFQFWERAKQEVDAKLPTIMDEELTKALQRL